MEFKAITLDECLNIRHAVLWPEQSRDFVRVPGDHLAQHYGVEFEAGIVCCLSVFDAGKGSRQIRKFATMKACQRKGFGSFLMSSVLKKLQEDDVQHVFLDSRVSGEAFYRRFNFISDGAPFLKNGIQYVRMHLAPQS